MTCETCRHYHAFAGEPRGECFRFPPTMDARGVKMRPPVKASERQCGEHDAGLATVAAKVNPETPGQAQKLAHQQRRK